MQFINVVSICDRSAIVIGFFIAVSNAVVGFGVVTVISTFIVDCCFVVAGSFIIRLDIVVGSLNVRFGFGLFVCAPLCVVGIVGIIGGVIGVIGVPWPLTAVV